MEKLLRAQVASTLRRTMPAQALRQISAFCYRPHAWHDEQCTLAEFCAYIAVDVIAHVELAAEARVKAPVTKKNDLEVQAAEDSDSDTEADQRRKSKALELVGVGGAIDDDFVEDMEDVPFNEVSSFPQHDPSAK